MCQIDLEFSEMKQEHKKLSSEVLRENNDKRKILFVINYITNNNKEIISPYLALKYNKEIQLEYLTKIYKSYSKEISDSKYGIELNKIINK